jgi:F5/8 type C domain-containing protein
MKSSKFGSSPLSKAIEQNANFKECNLMITVVLLLTYLISIVAWAYGPATTFFSLTQSAYGIIADSGHSVPKAFLTYGNQRYEMIPFVNFDGKNMNKIIYPSADVTTVLAVQEGDNASIDFSDNPVSVKAYIADYEADIPSLHALKELSNNKFKISGVHGLWNIEVHAIFPDHNALGSSSIDNNANINSTSYSKYRYVSYELSVDMMPTTFTKNANEIGKNTCTNKDIRIAKVSGPGVHTEYPDNFNNQLAATKNTNITENNVSNVLTIDSAKGNSSYIIDLGQNMPICSLGLKFSNGDKVVNHFNIQTSLDGNHFSKPIFYDNTAAVSGEESYDISSDFPVTTRYVKINFDGNTQGDVYAPMQVRVLGNS